MKVRRLPFKKRSNLLNVVWLNEGEALARFPEPMEHQLRRGAKRVRVGWSTLSFFRDDIRFRV